MSSTDPSPAGELPLPAPDLKTDTVVVGEAVVCVLAGDLHQGTGPIGARALAEALHRRPALLAVDLNAIELFSADGLNALLTVREAARDQGVPLVVLSPSRAVRRVLEVAGADGLFTVYGTVQEALAQHER
ncbi:STAS domain-containing protein [Streptomyces sp. NPDC093801]|uniref:STAS domain-containing protein n=1 Tax=Streptomyces sp. NPDC093801 TaxID=3155203 RepID=UPI00344E19CB